MSQKSIFVSKKSSSKMWILFFAIRVCSLFLIPELILAQGRCTVELKNLPDKTPVYELDNGELVTNHGKQLNFSRNQNVHATCGGKNNGVKPGSSGTDGGTTQRVKCVEGVRFSGNPGWITGGSVNFGDIQCKNYPTPLITTKENNCGGRYSPHTTVKVGVEGTRAHLLLNSCFDRERYRVLYVVHNITSQIKNIQSTGRPEFTTHDLFKPIRMDRIYTKQAQFSTFNTILDDVARNYLDDARFLVRGHLAPLADFALSPMQKASMTHLNAVPQWSKFNNGNWKTLERDIRARVVANDMRVQIYTGTFDTLKLGDKNNNLKEMYLNIHPRGIPVPLWIYKVVRDTRSGHAVVFLGLNNPFVSVSEARRQGSEICEDVCSTPSFHWLTWKKEDTELGYSMCCEVRGFRTIVNDLPSFRVNGLLDFGF